MIPLYAKTWNTLIFISVLWHHEHLLGYLHREHVAGSLTVWQIKPPYLCTCFFSQAASPFVCVNPGTWTVSQVWVYATSWKKEISSTRSTYLWRSEGLVQRRHRLSETFPKFWFLIIIYSQTVQKPKKKDQVLKSWKADSYPSIIICINTISFLSVFLELMGVASSSSTVVFNLESDCNCRT